MFGQGLHGRGQLQGVDARLVLNPLLVLELVSVKSTDKARQLALFLAREEAAANKPIGDVHDHQLLGRFFFRGFSSTQIGERMQKR